MSRTVVRIIDENGCTPMPPMPAFQVLEDEKPIYAIDLNEAAELLEATLNNINNIKSSDGSTELTPTAVTTISLLERLAHKALDAHLRCDAGNYECCAEGLKVVEILHNEIVEIKNQYNSYAHKPKGEGT